MLTATKPATFTDERKPSQVNKNLSSFIQFLLPYHPYLNKLYYTHFRRDLIKTSNEISIRPINNIPVIFTYFYGIWNCRFHDLSRKKRNLKRETGTGLIVIRFIGQYELRSCAQRVITHKSLSDNVAVSGLHKFSSGDPCSVSWRNSRYAYLSFAI